MNAHTYTQANIGLQQNYQYSLGYVIVGIHAPLIHIYGYAPLHKHYNYIATVVVLRRVCIYFAAVTIT